MAKLRRGAPCVMIDGGGGGAKLGAATGAAGILLCIDLVMTLEAGGGGAGTAGIELETVVSFCWAAAAGGGDGGGTEALAAAGICRGTSTAIGQAQRE